VDTETILFVRGWGTLTPIIIWDAPDNTGLMIEGKKESWMGITPSSE